MEEVKTIKGVIFARSWWEAVRNVLNNEQRLIFYDMVFRYAFEGEAPASGRDAVCMAFAMVKPFLDSEEERYKERCERNRKNAMSRKPVAASGTQSLDTNTNTNTSTNTNTNTNTNTISVSEERERFLCIGLFFLKGSCRPGDELERFWNYYESLGWRNNKGAAISKKIAAARMWKLDGATVGDDHGFRKAWYESMIECNSVKIDIFANLDYVELSEDVATIHARNVKEFAALCDSEFMAGLQRFAASIGATQVIYKG